MFEELFRPGSGYEKLLCEYALRDLKKQYKDDAAWATDETQFNPPYSKINGDLPRRRFVEKYFSSPKKYHLIFGAGDAGTLTITSGYWQDGSYAMENLLRPPLSENALKGNCTPWLQTRRYSLDPQSGDVRPLLTNVRPRLIWSIAHLVAKGVAKWIHGYFT